MMALTKAICGISYLFVRHKFSLINFIVGIKKLLVKVSHQKSSGNKTIPIPRIKLFKTQVKNEQEINSTRTKPFQIHRHSTHLITRNPRNPSARWEIKEYIPKRLDPHCEAPQSSTLRKKSRKKRVILLSFERSLVGWHLNPSFRFDFSPSYMNCTRKRKSRARAN